VFLEFEELNVKDLLNFGEMLSVHARLAPNRLGTRDLDRSMTFGQWNERSCRLANALLGLGLAKGDRIAILAYNCVEWSEIFAATAKAGLVALPINFRLVGKEVEFIVNNAEAAAFIVQDELAGVVEEIRGALPIKADRFIHFGTKPCPAGYRDYETFLAAGSVRSAGRHVRSLDPDVHLGHHRQPQGRGAQSSQRRAAVDGDRDRAWPAPQ
jgi:acyl-CoA synthetase (AMP-forming)/AMP-acid ligase II